MRPRKPIPVLKVDDTLSHDRKQQADALNQRFSKAGDKRPDDNFDNDFKMSLEQAIAAHEFGEERNAEARTNVKITRQEVENAIARVGLLKTLGPDKIHPMFIKRGGFQMLKTLTVLFNTSFLLGIADFVR